MYVYGDSYLPSTNQPVLARLVLDVLTSDLFVILCFVGFPCTCTFKWLQMAYSRKRPPRFLALDLQAPMGAYLGQSNDVIAIAHGHKGHSATYLGLLVGLGEGEGEGHRLRLGGWGAEGEGEERVHRLAEAGEGAGHVPWDQAEVEEGAG